MEKSDERRRRKKFRLNSSKGRCKFTKTPGEKGVAKDGGVKKKN